MNASATRLRKEARALFWPWCAVVAAGVLEPLWPPSDFNLPGVAIVKAAGPLGFFLGVPLLAVLAFGNEFQHRTLGLLLSQPVGRTQILREKLIVASLAVLSSMLVFYYGWRSMLNQEQLVVAGLYILAMSAAATYWTLLARSTIGGLVLGWLPFGGLELAGAILDMLRPGIVFETAGRLLDGKLLPHEGRTILFSLSIAALGYAGLMLWLGARKLARFQFTGGLPGDDLLMAGPKVMPEAVAGWFRYRPAEPVFNLVRKELRLLRPVWLMGLLLFVYLIGLSVFRLLPYVWEQPPRGQFPVQVALLFPLFALIPVMAILAGCLSLGEERPSGMHSWHMTLPVSARRQWFIKLLTGMVTGFVCAVLLPVLVLLADQFIFGSPFRLWDARSWMIGVGILSLVSFLCASAVSGTVRAALWVIPLLVALLSAFRYGDRTGRELTDLAVSRFDLFTDFGFTNTVSNLQLYSYDSDVPPMWVVMALLVPILLFAVIQSYRLFRAEVRDSALAVIRSLLPVALVGFLWTFSLGTLDAFVARAKQQMWSLFLETHEAITKIQPGTANLESAGPLSLTAEDLAKASPLSERARRWLGNSRITVVPDKPRPGPYCCGTNSRGIRFAPDKTYSWYLATIQRPGGSICTVSFQAGRGFGILGGVCE